MVTTRIFLSLICTNPLHSSSGRFCHPRSLLNSLLIRRRMTASSTPLNEDSPSKSHAANNAKRPFVDVYPFGTDSASLPHYSAIKTIFFVRHAEGTHNVKKAYRDMENLDARLTERGKGQCRALADRIDQKADDVVKHLKESAELVITSPMTRCVQTALLTMQPVLQARPTVQVIAHEGIRETVNYNCDRRRNLSEIRNEFPQVDFAPLADQEEDPLWEYYEKWLGSDQEYTTHRESAQIYKVGERGRTFLFEYLIHRPEEHIVLCSHRAFSRAFFNFGHGDSGNHTRDVEQTLDSRTNKEDDIIFRYMGEDETFGKSLRADYNNCELRAMILAFP